MPVEILNIPKSENALPSLQINCLKLIESQYFEMFSLGLISIYTIFILFWLTLASILNIDINLLAKIDTAFLTVFFTEIIIKTFASNLMFLFDLFNAFDAIIVTISEILNLLGIIATGLAVLRMIRVVVIIIRKITGN